MIGRKAPGWWNETSFLASRRERVKSAAKVNLSQWSGNKLWRKTGKPGMAEADCRVCQAQLRKSLTAQDGLSDPTISEEGRPQRKINPLPESAKSVGPKLLGSDALKLDPSKPYRPVLANWICGGFGKRR